jgi:hypothetical protein
MSEVVANSALEDTPDPGLASRLAGVVLSPRTAYAAVAAHPRWFGALAVNALIYIGAQVTFLSTAVGQNAALDQQLSVMKTFGVNVTDQMVQQMQSQLAYAPYTTAASLLVFLPIICAGFAGLLLAVFTAILGGGATYRQVFAMVSHSMIIGAIQQVFSLPIMYGRADMTSPTKLSVFFPMLDEMGFFTYLLSALDLFIIWSTINVAIGVAVLYKRQTGPVAAVLLGIYAVIAVIIAAVRAF